MSQKRRTPADEPFLVLRSSWSDVVANTRIGEHRHDWNQLVYVASGLVVVDTGKGSWLAPPSWAVWAPAGAVHALRFSSRSSLRTIYLRPDRKNDFPAECCSLAVSPLLRELILRTVELGMIDSRNAVEASMEILIISELGRSGPPPFTLPQPVSETTKAAANLLAVGPSGAMSISAVARAIGIGSRTLERQFASETGLTPGRWQQQHKLLMSLELIAMGRSVKMVASEAGFASASAYVAAFKKMFGTTPARYFASSVS